MTRFDSGIFFDNAHNHIKEFRDHTKFSTIDVGETSSDFSLPNDSPIYIDYIIDSDLRKNSITIITKFLFPTVWYDPKAGIKREHVEQFYRWISDEILSANTFTSHNKVAIFDWDRTLTVFEGHDLPNSGIDNSLEFTDKMLNDAWISTLEEINLSNPAIFNGKYDKMIDWLKEIPITVEEFILYLCGGEARVEMLREMFARCKASNTHVIILTNNSGCIYNYFKKMVDVLINGTCPYEIICSSEEPYRGRKTNLIYLDDRFINMRLTGGSRRRRRNIITRKRKSHNNLIRSRFHRHSRFTRRR